MGPSQGGGPVFHRHLGGKVKDEMGRLDVGRAAGHKGLPYVAEEGRHCHPVGQGLVPCRPVISLGPLG
ncbi:MAG: hypothetical protein M0Z94_03130 [Dehalococcoidales bacterium]|nr:hypothetical protein [Dehalococcoidales bacterium]